MSWWGKIAGGAFGFMLGGPLGALLGAVLGHNLDKGMKRLVQDQTLEPGEQERVQMAFFTATFTIMGHVAKVDGRVSKEEIALAQSVMDQMELTPDMRKAARELFNQGKQEGFPLDEVLDQFKVEAHRRVTLLRMFLEIQVHAAYADGVLDSKENELLLYICRQLGIPEFTYKQVERMIRAEAHFRSQQQAGSGQQQAGRPVQMGINDAYAILGVSSNASDAEVKKAYRRLMSQHHPDKLVAKGLPEEMMKLAAEKTHEIRQAYERIKEKRGL
jgi:DnaJ like chaperone protein